MPAMMACPHPGCDHPGPMGFSDPHPWGTHFYHESGCPGAWLYGDKWYATQADAWRQWKADNPGQNRHWLAAFDALIVDRDTKAYKKHINRWKREQEETYRAYRASRRAAGLRD